MKKTQNNLRILDYIKTAWSDEKFFTSKQFKERVTKLCEMVTNRYKNNPRYVPIKTDLYWDAANNSVACTDNNFIRINMDNKLVQEFDKSRRALAIWGFLAHELGHCLYTDFTIIKKFLEGDWDYSRLSAFDFYNTHKMAFLMYIKEMQNILEDPFIEYKITLVYTGSFKRGINFTTSLLQNSLKKTFDKDKYDLFTLLLAQARNCLPEELLDKYPCLIETQKVFDRLYTLPELTMTDRCNMTLDLFDIVYDTFIKNKNDLSDEEMKEMIEQMKQNNQNSNTNNNENQNSSGISLPIPMPSDSKSGNDDEKSSEKSNQKDSSESNDNSSTNKKEEKSATEENDNEDNSSDAAANEENNSTQNGSGDEQSEDSKNSSNSSEESDTENNDSDEKGKSNENDASSDEADNTSDTDDGSEGDERDCGENNNSSSSDGNSEENGEASDEAENTTDSDNGSENDENDCDEDGNTSNSDGDSEEGDNGSETDTTDDDSSNGDNSNDDKSDLEDTDNANSDNNDSDSENSDSTQGSDENSTISDSSSENNSSNESDFSNKELERNDELNNAESEITKDVDDSEYDNSLDFNPEDVITSVAKTLMREESSKITKDFNDYEIKNEITSTDFHKKVSYSITKIKNGSKVQYDYLVSNGGLKAISKQAQNKVRDAVLQKKRSLTQKRQPVGSRLDINAYAKRKKSDDFNIFINSKKPSKEPLMAVSVIVDGSGSMSKNSKMQYAKLASIILEDFCRNLNIPFNLISHDAAYGYVKIREFINFDSPKNERYNLTKLTDGNCNRDGFPIRYAMNKIKYRKEPFKLIIVISDGLPNDTGYGFNKALADITDIRKECKKKNIELIAFAIDSNIEKLKDLYGEENLVDCRDLSKFPKNISRVLAEKSAKIYK